MPTMRLLLDENLPKRLKEDFKEHEIFTVRDMGWNGKKNGVLLQLLVTNGFDVLLTFDKNLQHQQNFLKYSICVVVFSAPINSYKILTQLSGDVNAFLNTTPLPTGATLFQIENKS